ncbi:MAG: hypothetical protein WC532_02855 [Candidatus Omnitrophota bacterium]
MATKKKKKPVKKKATKKKAVKRTVKRKVKAKPKLRPKIKAKNPKAKAKAKKDVIGIVTHYFPHVRAAVIKLKVPLTAGVVVKIKGHTTDFTQNVDSMQIDRVPVNSAKKGDEIGLLVNSRVRQHDVVYKA